ncbi:hypothetical protein BS50DRAFT_614947 [Corynespora cassiicola Philippines]|uniref:MIT domain-containing protein n=1 Tax=Corynespora cassiicola Philippines TaxID=1448308 RepID=A0A2T2P8H5_CORCC|nr:hypothetical protein BS50DRAFT_614947 [Corynespora cassiicola Philippines]
MESAKLTEAHEHVRNAANATYGHSIATAGHEHELAAQAFHDAAHETTNSEALRILGLLQDHHNKLARLIKETPKNKPRQKDRDRTKDAEAPPVDQPASPPPTKGSAARTSSPSTSSPTRAPSHRRLPQSSIASNLAEKRGIPGARRSTPTTTPVSVANALATRNEQPATPVRDLLERQSRKAEASRQRESAAQDTNDALARAAPSSPTDDSFQRFYTTFGGIISAISAPLAFTSLPLSPAPPTPDEPSSPTKDKAKKPRNESPSASRTIKSSEPDLSSLISKPALRALREDGAAPLGPFANNESFYLVPTSGGTVSYASIVRDPQAHHHAAQNPHLSSIDEGSSEGLKSSSHEEFVDARESVGPPSPTVPRRPRSQGKSATSPSGAVANARTIAAGRGAGLKTMEEYDLEIETLKQLVDKQAKRLSMWESNSQASYNALAQSFRARNGGRPASDPAALAHALASQHPAAMAAAAVPAPAVASTSAAGTPATPDQQQQQPQSPQSPDPSTQRIAALEALLADATAKLDHANTTADQLAKQNEKNSQVIGRYREQWEKLKAGARKKEQERRERRVAELKAGQARARESAESGEGTGREDGEGEGEAEGGIGIGVEEEAGFGKA